MDSSNIKLTFDTESFEGMWSFEVELEEQLRDTAIAMR